MVTSQLDVDKETTKLANELRDVLGAHILKIESLSYKEILTSCILALCVEVGRIRWLSVETNEVEPDKFDEIFLNGMMVHFNSNKRQFGGDSH